MKWIWFFLALLYSVSMVAQDTQSSSQSLVPEYLNFYGISWRGTAHDNLAYARQMSHKYVFYQKGMELDPLSDGMYFYIETPEYFIYDRGISLKKEYTAEAINFYQNYCVLKETSAPFPQNLATGWIPDPKTGNFSALLDFQQQHVITWAIDNILNFAKSIEKRNPKFHFAGYAWDEPKPGGDFYDVEKGARVSAKLERWNREDRSARRVINKDKQFQTYTEGHLSFYKQLYTRTRQIYSNAHFISEPSSIYDNWIKLVQNRTDAGEVTPDILCQESKGTAFVDDERIMGSGLVKSTNVFSTTPNVFSEESNRTIAAKAAVSGAGFGWFGRFGGTGDMPNYKNIKEVPARLKLIRVLPAWENKNGTPLTSRAWDGQTYKSNNAFANADVIYAKKPGTEDIFAVFLTSNGTISLPSNKKVVSISSTTDLFSANGNAVDDFEIKGQNIKPKNDQCLNKGFIVTIR